MRLYFHPLSSNSRRVTMTAQQLGLELDLIIVDLLKGEHKDPEFLRFKPERQSAALGGRRVLSMGIARHHAVFG
jgi:glutathione S-transferase